MPEKLWRNIDGEPWLDNPKRRRRRKGRKGRRKRSPPKGFKSWKAYMKSIRPKRRRRRRRSRSRAVRSNVHMARRHRRRSHRRSRRHRSNPPVRFGGRGLMNRVMDGVKGGAGVVLGEAATGMVQGFIPVALPGGPIGGIIVATLTGTVLAPFVSRSLGSEWGKAFLWGAFARPMKQFMQGLPIIGPALSAYPGNLAAYPGNLAALPSGRASTLTLGDIVSEEEEEGYTTL